MDPIMSEFERTSCRTMLRHHVGIDIFCKSCHQILDCRRAVEMDFYKAGELVASVIRCATCFDQCGQGAIAHMNAQGLSSIVTDGRTLFAGHEVATAEPRKPRAKRIEPEAGHTYLVKHASGTVRFRLMHAVDRAFRVNNPGARAVWHWVGMNLKTGRVIELKSRAKFLEEVSA